MPVTACISQGGYRAMEVTEKKLSIFPEPEKSVKTE